MAIPISLVVNVQISLQGPAITQEGFGVPLILGNSKNLSTPTISTYFTLADVVADGYSSSTAEYKAAAAIFGQAVAPTELKIGQQGTQVAQVDDLVASVNFVASNTITGTVQVGAAASVNVSVPFNTDNATTLTALATAIQAVGGITAAASGAHTVIVTAGTAGIPFTLSNFLVAGGASQATFVDTNITPNHGWAEDLAAIQLIDDDWYGLVITSRSVAVVEVVAQYIETQVKIFGTCSNDTNILSAVATSDIAYILKQKAYNRTFVIYNATPNDFADAAWLGYELPLTPGSYTMDLKTLAGITVDGLTGTQYNAATAKNCNVYVAQGGRNVIHNGTMASGLFVDLRRFVDWLQATIEENIFALEVNSPKIPYTDPGALLIANQINAGMQAGVTAGGLAPFNPATDMFVPLVANQSPTNRAARYFPGITFKGTLAGAIQTISIQGTVTP